MFSLFYGFWKFLFKKDEYFVLILGLDNAGKSTFLEQAKIKFNENYKGIALSKITTTVGLNIGKVNAKGVIINFWDLGGQKELQSLWDKYYAEAHGIIYIIDSSDLARIEESKKAFDVVINNKRLLNAPLLFVANKQDLRESLTVEKINEIFKINSEHITNREFNLVACSALQGSGINDAIEWMINCVKENAENRPPHNNDD